MNGFRPGALIMHGRMPHVVVAQLDNGRVTMVPIRKYKPMQHRADVSIPVEAFPAGVSMGKRPRAACGYPVGAAGAELSEPIAHLPQIIVLLIRGAMTREYACRCRENDHEAIREHRKTANANTVAERA